MRSPGANPLREPMPPALDLIPSNLFRDFHLCQLPCSFAIFDHVPSLFKGLQWLSLLFGVKSPNLQMVSSALQDLGSHCLQSLLSPLLLLRTGFQLCSLPPRLAPLMVFTGGYVKHTTVGLQPPAPSSCFIFKIFRHVCFSSDSA